MKFTVIIKQEDGEEKVIILRRHLVQIGFGDPVQKLAVGPRITIANSMSG